MPKRRAFWLKPSPHDYTVVFYCHVTNHRLCARVWPLLCGTFFGVRVLQFSVGFGKALWQKTDKRGTVWILAPILLGGYVRMLDEETAAEMKIDPSDAIESKNNWQNFLIYAAGRWPISF